MGTLRTTVFLISIGFFVTGCGDRNELDPVGDKNFHHHGEVQVLFENDVSGINVVFMGDGFTRQDLAKWGEYEVAGRGIIERLFNVSPFSTYQHYFNAYIIYAESEEQGIGTSHTPKKTAFSVETQRNSRVLNVNPSTCYRFASEALKISMDQVHLVVLLANANSSKGSADDRVAVTAHNHRSKVAIHEVGHAFAQLADEYEDSTVAASYDWSWGLENRANVDNHEELTKIKWAHFVGKTGYEAVGAFEGGNYVRRGVWRPEKNSLMRDLSVNYFNAPSREAIVKRIFAIKGLPYDFETFLVSDVIVDSNFGGRTAATSEKVAPLHCGYIPR